VPDAEAGALPVFLIEKIATYNRELPNVRQAAIEGVLELLSKTGMNPLGARRTPGAATAQALPGLLSLAQLLLDLDAKGARESAESLGRLLRAAVPIFRHGDHLRHWQRG
jgi:hypothetical protein